MPTVKPRIGYTCTENTFEWLLNASQAHGMSLSEFVDSIVQPELKKTYPQFAPNYKTNVRAMHAKQRLKTEQKKAANDSEWRFV